MLPGLRCQTDLRVAGKILTEIKNRITARCANQFSGKAFLLQSRYAFRGGKVGKAKITHRYTVPERHIFHSGIIVLALLQVIFPDRSVLAGFPFFVTAQEGFSVCFQLAEQGNIIAVVIAQAVNAYAAAIPAVPESDRDFILPYVQKR